MQGTKQVSENLALKTYEKKVKEDIRLIHENLHEMLKLFKIEDDRTMKASCCSPILEFMSKFALIFIYIF